MEPYIFEVMIMETGCFYYFVHWYREMLFKTNFLKLQHYNMYYALKGDFPSCQIFTLLLREK